MRGCWWEGVGSGRLAVLAASALILGLLGMHVLTSGSTPLSQSNVTVAADSTSHRNAMPANPAPADDGGCDAACQTGPTMMAMGCILALVVFSVIMAALPRIVRLHRQRRTSAQRLILRWAPTGPPANPPDLNDLSISRT